MKKMIVAALTALALAGGAPPTNAQEPQPLCKCESPNGQPFDIRRNDNGKEYACLAVGFLDMQGNWKWSCAWHPPARAVQDTAGGKN